MSGIYFHIPFCKHACHYCDFHFSTGKKNKAEMTSAFLKELEMRSDYLKGETVSTMYFGGGTPSLLPSTSIESMINKVLSLFPISSELEITLEANPDDLSEEKLKELKAMGIHRLSIGTQSFDDTTLRFLNRAHTASEAEKSIDLATKYFENLNIDLIYGIHTQRNGVFENDVSKLLSYHPHHISAYSLTIEGNNAFARWVARGKMEDVDDDLSIGHFEFLQAALKQQGYEHYEISNFAKPFFESKHNTSYWFGGTYLGIGPSAHSFDDNQRAWNVANNSKYLQAIANNRLPLSMETLSKTDKINEFIMTRLRTKWGCDLGELAQKYDYHLIGEQGETITSYIEKNDLLLEKNILMLTEKGKLIADKISSDLFLVSR